MAFAITPYSIFLNTNINNCNFGEHLTQGSTDFSFIISILKDNVVQQVDSGAKVTLILRYNYANTCGTAQPSDYVLAPSDTNYDITITDGKINIPGRTEITNAKGTVMLELKIEDSSVAYTRKMLYIVDETYGYSVQSVPDNLPKFNDLSTRITKNTADIGTNKQDIASNLGKANTNTAGVSANKQDITALKQKTAGHDGDVAQVKRDITNLKLKDTAIDDEINDIDTEVQRHTQAIPVLQGKVQANANLIVSKAEKDLSNVQGFADGEDGDLFYKKDNKLVVAPLKVDEANEKLVSKYTLKVPANSIDIGDNTSIHENGGFLEYHTKSLNKNYLLLDYENDPATGTSKPIYYARGTEETNSIIQSVDDTVMNNVTSFDIVPAFSRQVQRMYFKLINGVNNFKMKFEINGKVAEYPAGSWDDDTVNGFNLGTNLQHVDLRPFWSSLVTYTSVKIFVKADTPVNMLGNGTLPWIAEDLNRITTFTMATINDVNNAVIKDTATEIRNKLQSLSGTQRLGIEDLKNVETTISGYYAKTKLEELTGEDRLDASAIKNIPTGGGGNTTFIGLTDTPPSYLGNTNRFLKVNADHTALEFADGTGSGPESFAQLTDTPNSIEADKMVVGSADGSNLIFKDIPADSDTSNLAKKDLTNIDNNVFKAKGIMAGLADGNDVDNLNVEVARIRSELDENMFTGRFSGNMGKIIDNSKPYKGYFITTYAIDDANNTLTLPSNQGLLNGTIFCIDNQDINSDVRLQAPSGEYIDGSVTSMNVPSENILFLVKDELIWKIGFGGFLPASLQRIIGDIKVAIPNIGQSGLTLPQIEAQLKDRLHTFAEIGKEFKDELHTIEDLKNKGIAWNFAEYDFTDDISQPYNDFKVLGKAILDQETNITSPNKNMYLRMRLPQNMATMIQYVRLEGDIVRTDMVRHVINYDETANIVYSFFYFTTPILANTNIKLHFDFYNEFPKATDTGITLQGDDTTELYLGVTDTYYPSAIVETDPQDTTKAIINPYVDVNFPMRQIIGEDPQPSQSFKANSLTFLPPLQGFSNPNKQLGVDIDIKHNAYERQHNAGFLAYLSEGEMIKGLDNDSNRYRKGTIYFDDIIINADGIGITKDANSKSYGIQEYDGKDPNISGGTDFLTALRVAFKGIAPSSGFIRIALIKKNSIVKDNENDNYITNLNGGVMSVERFYHKGDKLGVLEILGVINAKGLQEFNCIITTNITGDDIFIEDKEEELTGLMIQSLNSVEKTGLALVQYELDTQQDINFTAMYLGAERTTLKYQLDETTSTQVLNAGTTIQQVDGWGYTAIAQNTVVIKDNYMEMDNDFNLHKIFSADETIALRNKQIKVTTELYNPQTSYTVALATHTGVPDEYNKVIFNSRNSGGGVIAQGGWSIDFSTQQLINVNSSGFHTVTHNFTIPNNANNYAILIYPETDFGSAEIKLKDLRVDVVNPFIAYYLRSTEKLDEIALKDVERHETFVQNKQAYYSLRYTLTNRELPMPCGQPRLGNASIVVDPTVNVVQGSSAKGGEGAYKFLVDGSVLIKTDIRISNEKDANYNARFWYAKVSQDGSTYTKIDDSETTVLVQKNSKNTLFEMREFRLDVQAGDRIALRSQSDILDGAYIMCTDDSKPMLSVNIDFNELIKIKSDIRHLELTGNEVEFVDSNGAEVYNKKLQYNVSTGQMRVVDK